jgi:hypothetical protein
MKKRHAALGVRFSESSDTAEIKSKSGAEIRFAG